MLAETEDFATFGSQTAAPAAAAAAPAAAQGGSAAPAEPHLSVTDQRVQAAKATIARLYAAPNQLGADLLYMRKPFCSFLLLFTCSSLGFFITYSSIKSLQSRWKLSLYTGGIHALWPVRSCFSGFGAPTQPAVRPEGLEGLCFFNTPQQHQHATAPAPAVAGGEWATWGSMEGTATAAAVWPKASGPPAAACPFSGMSSGFAPLAPVFSGAAAAAPQLPRPTAPASAGDPWGSCGGRLNGQATCSPSPINASQGSKQARHGDAAVKVHRNPGARETTFYPLCCLYPTLPLLPGALLSVRNCTAATAVCLPPFAAVAAE